MPEDVDARQANEVLAAQIVDEAALQGIALSPVERRMLCFSEGDEMVAATAAFDQDFGETEYEHKVAGLIRDAHKRLARDGGEDFKALLHALRTLRRSDRYIGVIIRAAGISARAPHELLKLWATGFAVCVAFLVLIVASMRFGVDTSRETLQFIAWAIGCGVLVVYGLFYIVVGKARAIDLTTRAIERIMGLFGIED